MTNPCVYEYQNGKVKVDSKGKRIVDKEATKELKNREILTNTEINDMLENADSTETYVHIDKMLYLQTRTDQFIVKRPRTE